MDSTTKMLANDIIKRGWYRKSTTLGEGGWPMVNSSGIDWKTYVLFAESVDEPGFHEIETIYAGDDSVAMKAFESLYHLEMFNYWEVQERIVEYRLVGMIAEE